MFIPIKKWWFRPNIRTISFLRNKYGIRRLIRKLVKPSNYNFSSDLLNENIRLPDNFKVDLVYKLGANYKGTRIKFFDLKNNLCYSFPKWNHSHILFKNEFNILKTLHRETFKYIQTPEPVKMLNTEVGFMEELFTNGMPCKDSKSIKKSIELVAEDLTSFYLNYPKGVISVNEVLANFRDLITTHKNYDTNLNVLLDGYHKILGNREKVIPLAQVHGDLKHDNMLQLPNNKIAVVDWEFTRVAPVFYDFVNFSLHYAKNDVEQWLDNITKFGRYFIKEEKKYEVFQKYEMAAIYSLYRVLFQMEYRKEDKFETTTLLEKHQKLMSNLYRMYS